MSIPIVISEFISKIWQPAIATNAPPQVKAIENNETRSQGTNRAKSHRNSTARDPTQSNPGPDAESTLGAQSYSTDGGLLADPCAQSVRQSQFLETNARSGSLRTDLHPTRTNAERSDGISMVAGPKRKPGASAFHPCNTLNSTTTAEQNISSTKRKSVSALDVATSAGDNVPKPLDNYMGPSNKRQRREAPSQIETSSCQQLSTDTQWCDRDVAGSSRRSSAISLPSEERAAQTQSSVFRTDESRDVNARMAPRRKTRKPKSSSAASSQIDETRPSSIIELDCDSPPLEIDAESPRITGSSSFTQQHIPGHNDHTGSPHKDAIGTRSDISTRSKLSTPRSIGSKPRSIQISDGAEELANKSIRSAPQTKPTPGLRSAPRSHLTVLHEEGTPSRGRKASVNLGAVLPLRKRMLSNSRNNARDEGSEDELALESSIRDRAHPSGQRLNTARTTSPSDMRSTNFTTSRNHKRTRAHTESEQSHVDDDHTISLVSVHLLCKDLDCIDSNLILRYLPAKRKIQIEDSKGAVMLSRQGLPYCLTSKHAQKIIHGDKSCHLLGMNGSKDDMTDGAIWFRFHQGSDLTRCLGFIQEMTSGAVTIEGPRKDADRIFQTNQDRFEETRKKLKLSTAAVSDQEVPTIQTGGAGRGKHLPTGLRLKSPMMSTGMEACEYDTQRPTLSKELVREAGPASSPGGPSQLGVRNTRSQRVQAGGSQTKRVDSSPIRWSEQNPLPAWEAPLTYPPIGPKRTTVDFTDIKRLDDGELLNDNIISFCLRSLEEQHPHLKDQVYIFNTYFYTALSTKQSKKGFNYEAVKRWTKNIDIFSYPFIIVPVNVYTHWFVTVICNLDKMGRKLPAESDDESVREESSEMLDDQIENHAVSSPPALPMEVRDSPDVEEVRDKISNLSHLSPAAQSNQPTQVHDEVYEVEDPPDLVSTAPASKKTKARKGNKRAPPRVSSATLELPSIISLDSLGGSHTAEIRNLKEYVICEGKEKRSMSIDRGDIRGYVAKGIPEQTNFSDCGVYLIGYVTEFLKNPADFARKAISRELDKNNDFADFDPAGKRAEIRDQLLRLEKEQSEARKATKKASREAKLVAQKQLDAVSSSTKSGNGGTVSEGEGYIDRRAGAAAAAALEASERSP